MDAAARESDEGDYNVQQHAELVTPWLNDPDLYLSRYFSLHYHWDDNDYDAAVYCRQAPNKVCVVGVTPNHPALNSGNAQVQLVGKLESGKNVKPDTVLCELTNGDDESVRYPVKAHMFGRLLELNPRLDKEPELLIQQPLTTGYLAVILPAKEDTAIQLKEFVGPEEYASAKQRPPNWIKHILPCYCIYIKTSTTIQPQPCEV